jgi:AcrR family transcriptional regulator
LKTERTANARLDAIAATAADLFLDKGYDAASMADLAAATGLGKSSLYHHLSGKDQLLDHICGRLLAELRAGLDRITALPDPIGVKVDAALDHIVGTSLRQVAASNLLLTVKPTTETGRRVLDERRRLEQRIADLIASAQGAGAVRDDIDPLLLTRLVMGTIHGLVAWYRPEASELDPDTVRRAVVSLAHAAFAPTVAAAPPA